MCGSGKVGPIGRREGALEALPAQRVGPEHVQRVLGVGRGVVKERDAHAAWWDLAVDALDVGEHAGGQLVLVGVLARQAYGEVLDQAAHVRDRLLGAGAKRLQAVGVDDDELAPGRREPRGSCAPASGTAPGAHRARTGQP
jgi:hypothetical protein